MAKVTPEIRERMMKLWKENGLSYSIIAERFGVSINTVGKVIRCMNVGCNSTNPKCKRLTDEQKTDALRLRSEGLSYAEIGKRVDMAKSTVRYICKSAGKQTEKEPAAADAGQAQKNENQ